MAPTTPRIHLVLPAGMPAPEGWSPRTSLARGTLDAALLPDLVLEHELVVVVDADRNFPSTTLLTALREGIPCPGVPERLRRHLEEDRGPKAAFLVAEAAWFGPCLVVLLPADPTALDRLWSSTLSVAYGAPAEAEGPTTQVQRAQGAEPTFPIDPPALTGGVHVEQKPGVEAPTQAISDGLHPWQQSLAELGLRLAEGHAELPGVVERLAPLRQILESAGARRPVTGPDGERWTAVGFPDLSRASAKVLLLNDADDLEDLVLVALHRRTRRTGVAGSLSLPGLPHRGSLIENETISRTGRPAPGGGGLFAMDPRCVWLQRGGRIWSWDGKKSQDQGSPAQALVSLTLDWSQR